jgi:hypothetical protein
MSRKVIISSIQGLPRKPYKQIGLFRREFCDEWLLEGSSVTEFKSTEQKFSSNRMWPTEF